MFFLIFAQNIDCRYPLEPPHRGGSNEYPQSIIMKNVRVFLSEKFQFLEMKFSIYLNRRFFVMKTDLCSKKIARGNNRIEKLFKKKQLKNTRIM